MSPNDLFHFLRGALRGAYGNESFRNHKFLLIGMSNLGQGLLGLMCVDGLNVRFQTEGVSDYQKAFTICRDVDFYDGGGADIIVDLNSQLLVIREKVFPLNKISKNPYTQGIHEFYL